MILYPLETSVPRSAKVPTTMTLDCRLRVLPAAMVRLLKAGLVAVADVPMPVLIVCVPVPSKTTVPPLALKWPPTLSSQLPETESVPDGALKGVPGGREGHVFRHLQARGRRPSRRRRRS